MDAGVPTTPSSDNGPRKFFVAGVEVEFPIKPYKCQISTMNMVIRGLRHMTNTLIESPTGSGKTLSLICSSLAWQKAEFARLKEILEKEAIENAAAQPEETERQQMQTERDRARKTEEQKEEQMLQRRRENDQGRAVVYYDDSDEDMEDFQMRPKKIFKMMKDTKNSANALSTSSDCMNTHTCDTAYNIGQGQKQNSSPSSPSFKNGICQSPYSTPHKEESATQMDVTADVSAPSETVTKDAICISKQDGCMETEEGTSAKPQVPKIFYCSRTHQQIQQVVRELRKTVYKDVKMTILSSREHTCIQTPGSGHTFRSKTEMCCALLDPVEGRGCMYKNGRMSSHTALEYYKMESPWDLEDLVQAGRTIKSCPYFASRDLITTADIVFCPYIYLIDPKIRNTMNLQLRGAVILLDEAHNIEDCCRDAGSYSVLYDDIFQAMKDCKRVAGMEILPEIHNRLAWFLSSLMKWMSQTIQLTEHYETETERMESSTFGGADAVASFEEHGIDLESIIEFKRCAVDAVTETNSGENMLHTKESFERHGVLQATTFVLEGLSLVLGFMYDNDMEHIWDYYVVVCKNSVVSSTSRNDMPNDWPNARGRSMLIVEEDDTPSNWGHYLNFLCMNPGVVFRPIADVVRSIVLTSGTLAPLVTFNSELGTTFANELQALHIIDENQLWVGALGSGPGGRELQASYRLTDMSDFRQELGSTILQVCKVIPYGVLCFLPSYRLLESLRQQ
ncbi:Fanconi anemia group J protein isoform X2 [Cryptotermes secundus]|nr:Fanconi anemia group J protein isoform X2 [Cryptotermes secundus]